MTKYIFAILTAFLIAAGVMLKISWSANDALKTEKQKLETQLSLSQADLKLSALNSERMLAEKNRLIVMARKQAETNQIEAVQSAKIQKDIEYAQDSHECVKSEPVQRLLRGLRVGQATIAPAADDTIQGPGRTGNAVDLSPAPGRSEP